jgi:hypothetical protein
MTNIKYHQIFSDDDQHQIFSPVFVENSRGVRCSVGHLPLLCSFTRRRLESFSWFPTCFEFVKQVGFGGQPDSIVVDVLLHSAALDVCRSSG